MKASISETSNTQKQPNVISVSLIPNVELVTGTRITISGMIGTATASSSALQLQGDVRIPSVQTFVANCCDLGIEIVCFTFCAIFFHVLCTSISEVPPALSLFDATGSLIMCTQVQASFRLGFTGNWNKQTGTLIVEAMSSLNSLSSPGLSFAFVLKNALSPQPASNITVKVSTPNATVGSCSALLCDVGEGFKEMPLGRFSDSIFLRKESAVLLQALETPQFNQRTITESTNVPNEDNVIAIVLQANLLLPVGTVITIAGLLGTQTPDTDVMPLDISSQQCSPLNADPPKCPGVWKQQTGKLTFGLLTPFMPGQTIATIRFVVRNPSAPQQNAVPLVFTSEVASQALEGSVLNASSSSNFTELIIEEGSNIAGEINWLLVSMKANIAISQGANVTISGLVGRGEAPRLECSHNVGTVRVFSLGAMPVTLVNQSGHGIQQVETTENSISLLRSSNGCTDVDSVISFELPQSYGIGNRISFRFSVLNAESPR